MRVIAVGGEALADIEAGRTAGDHIEQPGRDDRADDLRDDVGQHLAAGETPACGEPDRNINIS